MTSICLLNFVLLTLIWTILHVFRTIFLYYKGGEGVGGVGGPRNNNVQPRPVESAWIFLAGGGGGVGVICHKKVQQSYLNQSLEPQLKSPLVCPWCVVKTSWIITFWLLWESSMYVCMYVPVHSLHVTCFRCLLTTILLTYFCSNYPDPVYIKI